MELFIMDNYKDIICNIKNVRLKQFSEHFLSLSNHQMADEYLKIYIDAYDSLEKLANDDAITTEEQIIVDKYSLAS